MLILYEYGPGTVTQNTVLSYKAHHILSKIKFLTTTCYVS